LEVPFALIMFFSGAGLDTLSHSWILAGTVVEVVPQLYGGLEPT
jgi:hypothetical protein